jgi:hypothetical protein
MAGAAGRSAEGRDCRVGRYDVPALHDVKSNPLVRRDYLAWAQGFMSGILLSRPAGVDEGLDLNPTTFNLVNQLHFLEDHCAKNTSLDFSDAVEALYKRLRQEGKT